MRVTAEDFKPRRDGWFEHAATWAEVTRGTIIATDRRSERWEIIDVAHGLQTDHGYTLWMRGREQNTGEERTIAPRLKTSKVLILNRDPADTTLPPVTPAADAEAVRLLVEELGATEIATYDATTGEVTCPAYDLGDTHLDITEPYAWEQGILTHLRLAHGMDTTDLEALGWEERIPALSVAHGRSHNQHKPEGKGGFPHRHIPEDLTIYTGRRA